MLRSFSTKQWRGKISLRGMREEKGKTISIAEKNFFSPFFDQEEESRKKSATRSETRVGKEGEYIV
jgi:hypothetical protein